MQNINIKMTVVDNVDFKHLKPFIELAETDGYNVLFVDNGNIVFEKDDLK